MHYFLIGMLQCMCQGMSPPMRGNARMETLASSMEPGSQSSMETMASFFSSVFGFFFGDAGGDDDEDEDDSPSSEASLLKKPFAFAAAAAFATAVFAVAAAFAFFALAPSESESSRQPSWAAVRYHRVSSGVASSIFLAIFSNRNSSIVLL